MNDFYEIMDLLYEFNKSCPRIRFGQLIECCYNKNVEDLFYLSDEEIKKRLQLILDSFRKEK